MKKILIGAALVAALAGTALAGTKVSWSHVSVYKSSSSSYALGELSDTRATADTQQYIGCYVNAYQGSSTMQCYARDTNGVSATCYSSDPELVRAAASVDHGSFMWFFWNSNGQCTHLEVVHGSEYTP